ncbi:PC3-like endoprotease variant A, partial [Paramuricea clavata]
LAPILVHGSRNPARKTIREEYLNGVRMLDGKATDALEASGLSFGRELIDVYVNCWGPKDDGKTFGKPGPLAGKALREGATMGRKGKGNIYVWATGNGGLTDDDCNCDGYTTSIYTISIGCISDHGLSTYYTELCASTLAVTFNGGAHREREENKMITTDLFHKCTEEFKGTSSAAPIAAGIFSLTLEANPNLTWRDMQHVIVETAQMTSPVDEGWMKNGAGKHFNHKFGFGRMDAAKMVERVKTWTNVGPHKTCVGQVFDKQRDVPSAGSMEFQFSSDACIGGDNQVDKLEHVVLTVSFIHRRRGDLSLLLISPSGTKSELLSTRRYDDSKEGLDDWKFMTVHFWGENPKGLWKVKVTDSPLDDNGQRMVSGYGTLHADTSKQEHDVEDLEQQVIDDQTKQQQNLVDQMKTKDPHVDFPYPPGVRRDHLNSSSVDALGASPQYSSNFNYNGVTSSQSIKRWKVPLASTLENPKDSKRADMIRKVQVATEEQPIQRVQVNAGYENPEIVCLGSTCSGVFLRYGLTLHGTREGV